MQLDSRMDTKIEDLMNDEVPQIDEPSRFSPLKKKDDLQVSLHDMTIEMLYGDLEDAQTNHNMLNNLGC